MIQRRLPYPTPGKHFVQLLASGDSSRPGAVLSTEDGNVSVWPDLADAAAPPLQARIAGSVTAMAAGEPRPLPVPLPRFMEPLNPIMAARA